MGQQGGLSSKEYMGGRGYKKKGKKMTKYVRAGTVKPSRKQKKAIAKEPPRQAAMLRGQSQTANRCAEKSESQGNSCV